MPKFLLPAFRGAGGEPAPQGTRTWELFPMSELGRFATALAAPKDLPVDLFVDAIPDVWSKALLFAYALSDEGHTLHSRAAGSFRGFLAMLALRSAHKYPVTAVKVELDAASALPFEAAVARLLPGGNDEKRNGNNTLSNAAGWNPAYVFVMGDEPVGVCSPLTFFAPHEGPDMKTASDRGLTDGFRFTDPTTNFGPLEAGMLHQWLGALQQHLVRNAQEGLWRRTVTSQILAFQNDLRKRAGTELPSIAYDQGDLTDITTPFFQPLGKSLARMVGDLVKSDFELRQRPQSKDHVLVIDEGIIEHLPPGAEIITGISAALLKDQTLGTDGRHLGHYEMPSGWRWLRPADFLLNRMTAIQSKDAFVGVAEIRVQQGKASDPTPIPPLKENVTEYLDYEYIKRSCWFERTNTGFTFRLQLPVYGKQPVEARRSYNFTDLKQIELLDMPVVEIWPARKLENWKSYYTFWTRVSDNTRFYVSPCGLEVSRTRKKTLDRSSAEEVTLTKQPPGYLACYELVDGHDGIYKEPLGLLMPAFRDASATATHQSVTIGFDFGTTNTNIFLATEKDATPRQLTISPFTLQIVNNEKLTREGLMYRRFLPADPDEAPFLSLLRRRTNLSGGFEPLRDAHVLFYHQHVEKDQFDDSDIVAYLKWTTATFNDDRVAFLKQLVLHAAYEARLLGANELRFNYSYPTSFDENTDEMLQSFWNSVPKMSELIGVPCQLGQSQTESVATAVYFARRLDKGDAALLGTGAMVLDIGGGTTDISVWRNRDLQIQTSIRLSGREILLVPMEENKGYVIKMLSGCMHDGTEIFEPLRELAGDRFYRRADAILRAHGDVLVERLASLMKDDDFERFRSEIALRLTALVYFAGLLLRRKNWLESGARLPDLYIGGNGSRIFNWLAPPEFQTSHAVMDLLLAAYARGAGADQTPSGELRVLLSPDPKSEVACGLVYEDFPEASKKAIETVAGESFEIAGQAFPETEPLTASLLQRGIKITQAQEIEQVLAVYNQFTNRRGAIFFPVTNSKQIVQRAMEKINDWAGRRRSDDVRNMSVEPIFIVGVNESFSLAEWNVQANAASA